MTGLAVSPRTAQSRVGPERRAKFEPWNDPAAVPYLRIEAVTKRFGEFVAVDAVSLDIYRKELFCLLGASGCGKTTLLRMLAGFEVPSSGRILIDGQDMTNIPPYDRPVNMMFQSYALFPHMTVEQNVAFGLKQDRVPRAERNERVREMLELVQLGPWAKSKPHQLSGGQRQRVALARALVKRPKLLLLDEPLAALDRKLRERTQFELMNIQDEVGITFVVVTHDQEEAMTLSTRMAVMDSGRLVQVGTPTEIYEFPRTRLIADFIGSINLMEGRIAQHSDGQVEVEVAELDARLWVQGRDRHWRKGQAVWVAVRPEKIAVCRNDGSPAAQAILTGPNVVRGTVRDLAYLGDASIFRVATKNGALIEASQPNLLRSTERAIDWDDEVVLGWSPDAAQILSE